MVVARIFLLLAAAATCSGLIATPVVRASAVSPSRTAVTPQMGILDAIAGLFGRKKVWPAIGGTTGYHRGAGRWPPPATYSPKPVTIVESWYDSGLRLTAPEEPKTEEPKPEPPKAEEPKPAKKQSVIQVMKGVVKPTKAAEAPATEVFEYKAAKEIF